MHIGFYTECLTRTFTGVEVHAKALIEEMSKTGHEVTCFYPSDSRHPAIEGARMHELRKKLPIPLFNRLAALFRTGIFEEVDIFHLPQPDMPYIKKPKKPVVMTVHDITPVFMPQVHNWKRAIFFKHLLPRYLKKTDAILASSSSTKNDLIKHYKIPQEKIHVTPLALTTTITPCAKKENYFLYLGTLEPRKNVEGIIKAFSILKRQGRKEKLVIAGGKGWQYERIFALIQKLNLSNDVIYRGYVTEQEKTELYQKAKLFVWPSLYEGFGLPVIEAMAHGTPVVTSNTSSLPEVAGDAALLVNPHDINAIAQGINEALSPPIYNNLIRKGLKNAGRFTIKNTVKKTLEVYEQVTK